MYSSRSDCDRLEPSLRLIRYVAKGLLILVLIAFAASVYLYCRPVIEHLSVQADTIVPVPENGYAVPMPSAPWAPILSWNGDDYTTHRSALRMSENGQPLKAPHSSQISVHRQGLGRYVHMGETGLHFSTSDNSDPRVNGRAYVIRAEASPHKGLIFGLFVTAIGLGIFLVSTSSSYGRLITLTKLGSAPIYATFLIVTVIWMTRIWTSSPLILDLGDPGNVASIAAGWLFRDRFAGDPVLQDSIHSAFYLALSVPFTMVASKITGDVGQAYVLLAVPTLLLQMCGFYLLGRRLFIHKGWAALLALLSVPPVYVFSGELWGNLGMPLTRAVFGALLPFVMLAGLSNIRLAAYRPFVAMLLCGVGIYIHPVSAPSVAFACWFGILLTRPVGESWRGYAIKMIGAGALFCVVALPFAFSFFSVFPTTSSADSAHLAVKALHRAAGEQFFQAGGVARSVLVDISWGWRWVVWIVGIGALFALPLRHPASRHDVRFLAAFLAGVIFASLGLSWVDQTLAAHFGREPLQIDLVRNVRFVVPLLLVTAVYWMAMEFRESRQASIRASALAAIGVIFLLSWIYQHPTPPTLALNEKLSGEVPSISMNESDQRVLSLISQLPGGSVILPLPAMGADTKIELVGLAVRYAAKQPVAFLGKDLNLLSYSSSPRVAEWLAAEADLRRLDDPNMEDLDSALARVVKLYQVSHLLLHTPSTPSRWFPLVKKLARTVAESGDWTLLEILRDS